MEYTKAQQILELPEPQRSQVLQQYLEELADKKKEHKYGLYWNDTRHPEDVVRQCDAEMPILEEVIANALHHKPEPTDLFDTPDKPEPTHVLIEGDNYHALAVLAYTHARKVDVIYIDPPYNTGNRDFRYNDRFVEKEDGDRHTKWLSFMQRRLKLAKELLKDTGVIFISIDENEIHNLRHLLDKIFGENNFIEQLVWNKRIPKNDKGIGNIHEYILLYARNYSTGHIFVQKKEGIEDVLELVQKLKKSKIPFKEAENELNKFYKKNGYDRGITLYNNFDKNYRLFGKINVSWPNAKTVGPRYDVLHPKTQKPCKVPDKGWRFTKDTFESMIDYKDIEELHNGTYKCGRVWFAKDENTQPSTIKYLDEVDSFLLRSIISTKSDGGNELYNFSTIAEFNYPKPTDLIELLINSNSNQNAIILDFFAGSGTTLHAVLELNKADGGNRQCILVTNNEVTDKTRKELKDKGLSEAEIDAQGICRAVTYPRVKKVIEGYTTPKGAVVKGTGGKLRYFRCAFVPRVGAHIQNAENIKRHCTEMLCLRENIFTRIYPETLKAEELDDRENYMGAFEIFQEHERILGILYDDSPAYKEDLRNRLNVIKGEKKLYVFTPTGNVSRLDYADFEGVTLEEIPRRILDLYKRILQ